MEPRDENSRDLLWILLALVFVGDDDDGPWRWELYEYLERHLRRQERSSPELDRILHHFLRNGPRPGLWRRQVIERAKENTNAALEGFRQSFQQPIVDRLTAAESASGELRRRLDDVDASLGNARAALLATRDEWLTRMWLGRLGIDPADVGLREYVPVRVYIGEPVPEREAVGKLLAAVADLAGALGIEVADDLPLETGSVKKRWWVRIADFFRSRNASDQLERAVVATLDQQRANRDHTDAEAARARAQALREEAEAQLAVARAEEVRAKSKVHNAEAVQKAVDAAERLSRLLGSMTPGTTIQLGDICIAKRADSTAAIAAVLSAEQLREWERQPALQSDPARAHAQLEAWKDKSDKRVITDPIAARFANLDLDPPDPLVEEHQQALGDPASSPASHVTRSPAQPCEPSAEEGSHSDDDPAPHAPRPGGGHKKR